MENYYYSIGGGVHMGEKAEDVEHIITDERK